MILLFDTSTSHLAIGLADDSGALLHEFHADAAEGERGIHDARLAMETANIFAEAGIAANDLSRIGLIIGPGSFTGLRIGLSFAKGLCFATGAGIVPLTQHEVMRQEASGMKSEYIITPGYREELFYVSSYERPREIRLLDGNELSKLPDTAILAHDSFLLHPSSFIAQSTSFISPSLAAMACMTVQSGALQGTELDAIEPLYITEFKTGK